LWAIVGIIIGSIGTLVFICYFLVRGVIALQGAIKTEKVLRVAIKEYVEKRNSIVLTDEDLKEMGEE
jgi:hypothetical protein